MLNKLIIVFSLAMLLVGCNKNLTDEEKKEMWSKAQTEGEIIRRSGTPFNLATDRETLRNFRSPRPARRHAPSTVEGNQG